VVEIRVTVVEPASRRRAVDLRVVAPAGTTLAEARPHLLAALGRDDGEAPVSCDGWELAASAVLGEGALLEGAVLCVGRTGGATGRAAGTSGGVLELHVVGGPDAGRVHRLAPGTHRLGRAGDGVLAVDDPDASRLHAEIAVSAPGITVRDLGSTNGTRVDGERLGTEPVGLTERSRLVVGSSTLVLRVPDARTAATAVRDGLVEVNRAPRTVDPVRPVVLHRPTPPPPRRHVRVPLVAVLVPPVLAVPLALLLGSWYFLLLGLLSPAMLLGNLAIDRVTGRREHRAAVTAYEQDVVRVEQELADALVVEQLRRRAAAPDAAEVLRTATTRLARLWERDPAHEDLLDLRVGTATLPSRTTVMPAAGAAAAGVRVDGPDADHPVVADVPVVLPLADLGVVGLAGPRARVLALARSLVGQVATLHSPRHVGLVVLVADDPGRPSGPDRPSAPDRPDDWSWTAWLPHARPADGLGAGAAAAVGLDAEQRGRRVAELVALLDDRLEQVRPGAVDRRRYAGRHVVVVLDGAQRLRAEAGVARLLELGPSVGITAICLDDDASRLPAECRGTVVVGGEVATRLRVSGVAGAPLDDVVADLVAARWAVRLARALAPLRDATPEAGSGLPEQVRLLDLLGLDAPTARAVAERWAGSPRCTTTVLGVGGGGPVPVDLRRDGPHALVAGTTGSGKSELLQTLVAGLAVANRPDEMVFVLVDYKGGAAFARCAQLPHTVGLVTDLDGALTARALTSLGAEVARRERLLADAGAADLDAYLALRDRPGGGSLPALPRLVIVVDEFRVLAEELPDFVAGLVRLAAVGRSLGLHLVLATQRPAGVVSAEITANTNLRVALRVQEPSDSLDVVDSPAAASLPVTVPGRALLRCGSDALVELQTARVAGAGGSGPAGVHVTPLRWARAGDPLPAPAERAGRAGGRTDLDDLVDAVVAATDLVGCTPPPSPWLPPLPTTVPLDALGPVPTVAGGLALPFGLLDEPAHQRRGTAAWDLLVDGPLAVVGGPRSGRTTLVRALLASLAASGPGAAWAYVLDGSGALAGAAALPQVGAVVARDDTERTLRVLDLLHAEVGRRQAAVTVQGAADLAEQRRRAADLGELPLPWVVLVVDGWEAVQAAAEQHGALRVVDGLLHVLRHGPAVGVLAVVTGGRSVLSGQVGAALARRVVLRTTDTGDAVMAGVPSRAVPTTWPPGRALLVQDDAVLQAQVALLDPDPSGAAQAAALAALASADAPAPGSPHAPPPVPPMPVRVTLAEVSGARAASAPEGSGTRLLIGLGGPRVEPQGWDPAADGAVLLVAGHPGSGRTTALRTLARGALAAGRPVVAVAGRRSALEQVPGVAVVRPDDSDALDAAVEAARSRGAPALVLVDDVEALDGRGTEPALARLVADLVAGRGDGPAEAVAAAGCTPDLLTRYSGLAVQLRRPGTGLLLGPAAPTDGDLLGVRLGRAEQRTPGRGVLVRRGAGIPLQVALP
jgi:S-DNA-T family DNA segregation ATPase FtsK/SpoIIIE